MDVQKLKVNKMIEQRTPEWFAQRTGRVTASSVGAILGLSPFMKREDVMRNMVREYHDAEREFKGNQATEYGTFHENLAKMDYQLKTGVYVEKCGFYTHDYWLGASPDGFAGFDKLIEIKCPYGQRDKNPPVFKSILDQPNYYAQIQVQLFVTHMSACDFYQWSPNGDQLETIDYDREWINKHLPILKSFHTEYLIERDNPEKYLQDKRATNNANSTAYRVEYYFELSAQIAELEAIKKGVLEHIVRDCKEQDSDINGHKLTKVVKKGAVSYAKAVKELLPDADLTPYMSAASEYWRLS
jgi:putative phage-type endonuclease